MAFCQGIDLDGINSLETEIIKLCVYHLRVTLTFKVIDLILEKDHGRQESQGSGS